MAKKIKFKFNLKNYLPLFALFIAFIFLRLYLLPETLSFGWDQERDATVIKKIYENFDLPLIGPRVVGDHGFYLGPYFFYLLAPFYFLTMLHPSALYYFLIFYSSLFFIFAYFILKKIFSPKFAFIFLFLWTFTPLCLNQDRIAWNPFLIPLSFIIILYFLSRMQNRRLDYLILGLILGFSYHLHFQSLFYIFFALVYLLKKFPHSWKNYFWIFPSFTLSFLPLLLFDLRHQWLNFNLFISFFFGHSSLLAFSPFAFLPVWNNFVAELFGLSSPSLAFLFWFILIIISFKYRRQPFILPSLLLLIFSPLFFALYGHRPSEYYFNYLLPIILIILTLIIEKININFYFLLIIFPLSFYLALSSIKINQLAFYYKDSIVKNTKSILRDQSASITYETPLGENSGFDYLIDYYHINRSLNPLSPGIRFIIPKVETLPTFGNISLFLPARL